MITVPESQDSEALKLHKHALALEFERRLDEAVACQLKAVTLAPQNPLMHLELGLFLLRRGEFGPGLIEYEWRWRLPDRINNYPRFGVPRWNGMTLKQGRILLFADQGAGDKIQFARYIPMVAARCKEVVMICPPATIALLAGVQGVAHISHRLKDIPAFDVQCPLSSLPFVFGTRLDTIPARTPYLAADPRKAASWASRLDARTKPGEIRVGIAWAGSPHHANDQNRSTRLAQWQNLLSMPGVNFVSVQKEIPEADRGTLAAQDRLIDLTADLGDFSDTAALIANLDLVISVDTSVVHLAGALGKPAWVFLPRVPDWRWLLGREDSPWYPTLRLFRQEKQDDYDAPFARVRADLQAVLAGDHARLAPFKKV
jgi:hypothetical protein